MIKPKYGTIENKNKNKELLKKYPFLRPSPLFVKNGDLYNCSLNIDGNFFMDDTYLEMIFYKNFNGDKKQINNILKKIFRLKESNLS